MSNQVVLEENLKLFLTELARSLAMSIHSASGKRIEAKVDTGAVLALSKKITASYHQWTENYLHPYCPRSELAAVLSVELFCGKPLIQCQLHPKMLRPLHNLCVVYSFAYVMGIFVKLAGSPQKLRDQFAGRFINQVSTAVKRNRHKAIADMHRFIERKFPATPAAVHFSTLKNEVS